MKAALILGKFYPPHAGHLHLLKCALSIRERVVVLCLGASSDSFSPSQRLDALLEDAAASGIDTLRISGRAGYDQAPFDLADSVVWDSHTATIRAFLVGLPDVDVVVTSEAYGPRLAEALGVGHHDNDLERVEVPLSSTALRNDLVAAWDSLGPGTRRLLTTRVVLLGAESTGTSAVAAGLADRLRARGGAWALTRLVHEYGRELTERKQRIAAQGGSAPLSVDWTQADFAEVVAAQSSLEEEAAAAGGPVLVCDTDAFATPVWERRYLGIERARLDPADHGRGAVYLLTHHDGVPFTQDGTRDGQHLREQMTEDFLGQLIESGKPFAVLTGTLEQRIDLAERITDQAVHRRLVFSAPI